LDVEPIVLEEGMPLGRASVQVSWLFPKGEVCVVGNYHEGVSGELQVLTPMFEQFDYYKQFSFVNVIVALCWDERGRVVGDWVKAKF
jgi:hypothetical protein